MQNIVPKGRGPFPKSPIPALLWGRDVQSYWQVQAGAPRILAEANVKEGGAGGDQAKGNKGQLLFTKDHLF